MEIRPLDREIYAGKTFTACYRTNGYYEIRPSETGFQMDYVPFAEPTERSFDDVFFGEWLEDPIAFGAFEGDKLIAEAGSSMKYKVGTMIEIPRAALTADEIAKEADFFSFGTNDLTQMTFGFSRDDAGKFLGAYYDKKIYESDPFARLDQTGVGKLVSMAAKMGRETNPHIHLGICGEHGGDPTSVEFCHKVGLDYVSCSPFRVPIARLAAAQAAIKDMQ